MQEDRLDIVLFVFKKLQRLSQDNDRQNWQALIPPPEGDVYFSCKLSDETQEGEGAGISSFVCKGHTMIYALQSLFLSLLEPKNTLKKQVKTGRNVWFSTEKTQNSFTTLV